MKIKFRGKRIDNGEWVYGWYYQEYNRHYIGRNEHIDSFGACQQFLAKYEVAPETVGQYTGLKDKNEIEIYTGDTLLDDEDFYIVEFDEGCFVAILDGNIIFPLSEIAGDCEIIGNIYDKMESQDED